MADDRWAGPQVGGARRLDWTVLDALEPFDVWPCWSEAIAAHLDGLAPSDLAPGPLRSLVSELYRPVLFEWWRLYQLLIALGGLALALGIFVVLIVVLLPGVEPAASPLAMTAETTGAFLFMLTFYPALAVSVGVGVARLAPADGRDLKVLRAAAALSELREQDQLIRVPRGWVESVPTGRWAMHVVAALPTLDVQIEGWRAQHANADLAELIEAVAGLRILLVDALKGLQQAIEAGRRSSLDLELLVVDWAPSVEAFNKVESLRHGLDRYDRLLKALPGQNG